MDTILLSQLKKFKEDLNNLEITFNQSKSNTDTINKAENELKFKLKFELKEKIVNLLNDFTALLNNNLNSTKINQESKILMHNLIDLPLKLDDENQTESINLKPTLIIDLDMKKLINDLLFRNMNFSIIYKNDGDAKSNLIQNNNNIIRLLNNMPIKMLSNDLNDNQLISKLEFDNQINKYEMEIANLNDLISDSNEIAFAYEFKEIKNFINHLKEDIHVCPTFRCLSLDWCLKIVKTTDNNLIFYLVLLYNLNHSIKLDGKLKIINQQSNFDDEIITFSSEEENRVNHSTSILSSGYKKLNCELSFEYLNSNGFVKDDKIILQFYMKAHRLFI